MKTSKLWTILLCLFPTFGTFGQTITTFDSRKGIEPIASNFTAVDIAITDVQANPSYAHYLRGLAAPAMFDANIMQGVMITGTVEQAEADLNKLKAWSVPVTPRQFKLALLDIDVYPETVESAIATIEDQKLRTAAQIEWREASVFRRDHPLLLQIAPLLGATDEQLDAIFLNAQSKE
jgi:hypothetical protein